MHRFWEHIVGPLLDAAKASTVVEIGVDKGDNTRLLLERAKQTHGVVHAIDPLPAIDVAEWQAEYHSLLHFHRERSHDALPRLGPVDAALIDGDHNWYTVRSELDLLTSPSDAGSAPPPLVIAHDVGWPYGRRDMYYDPNAIPEQHRRDPVQEGILPGEPKSVPWGFNYWLWNARNEGGPCNGVLTAIEDFVAASPESWELVVVEGFHGLGVLAPDRRLSATPTLRDAFAHLRSHEFAREWNGVLELARLRAEIETWRLMGSPRG